MQTVGVTVGIFAVEVTVEYKTNAADVGGLVKGVGDRLVGPCLSRARQRRRDARIR
jgi:hypothetical protein